MTFPRRTKRGESPNHIEWLGLVCTYEYLGSYSRGFAYSNFPYLSEIEIRQENYTKTAYRDTPFLLIISCDRVAYFVDGPMTVSVAST